MRGGALQVGGLARGRQCLSTMGMPVVYSEIQEAQEIKKKKKETRNTSNSSRCQS